MCVCVFCHCVDRSGHRGYCLTEEVSGEQVSKSNKVEINRQGETDEVREREKRRERL